ncbi:MAG: hypothetical protein LBM96_08580 [Methanobrevibacter sp.]|jgi:hypothetical protein|nr:hypothetical protein [Candidatus Methanoflexus mossambicus]
MCLEYLYNGMLEKWALIILPIIFYSIKTSISLGLEYLYNVLAENWVLIIPSIVFSIIEISISAYSYIKRKDYLTVSKWLIIIGIIGIVYITLMIILVNNEDIKTLAALYILFVSLIVGAINLHYNERIRVQKLKNLNVLLLDSIETVNNKAFEYWARLDKNNNCLSDYYPEFQEINFIFKDYQKTLIEIIGDEEIMKPLLIVDGHVDIINRDLPELRNFLKLYDESIGSPGVNLAEISNELNRRKKALYRWSCRLAIYSEVLISNNLKINENDENYKVFDEIIKAETFDEITKIVSESSKFKEKEDYFCDRLRDNSGQTVRERGNSLK